MEFLRPFPKMKCKILAAKDLMKYLSSTFWKLLRSVKALLIQRILILLKNLEFNVNEQK